MVLQPRQDKPRRFKLFRVLLATTNGIDSRYFPADTEMFHFSARFAQPVLCIQTGVTPYDRCRVSPFGNLRIKACVPLPEAYRSLLRPSSPDDAKASINCCNWFMQTLAILGVYFTHLHILTTLNFQRTKSLDLVMCHLPPPPLCTSPVRRKWWAQVDLNHRPRAYQARALTN